MSGPRVCVIRTDGTNCDAETARAFELAGGVPSFTHVNTLRDGQAWLRDSQILAISGGFSYGDDIASGKVLAIELLTHLRDQLEEFVAKGGLVLGVCNGFQVLVRTGLLPFGQLGTMPATLAHNTSGRFQCAWVDLTAEPLSPCVFTRGLEEMRFQIAHGEGRFLTPPDVLKRIEAERLVALRYVGNPNGSQHQIAGLCDPTGRVFGLMPHPERNVRATQDANWRRGQVQPHGLKIFENAVQYAAQS